MAGYGITKVCLVDPQGKEEILTKARNAHAMSRVWSGFIHLMSNRLSRNLVLKRVSTQLFLEHLFKQKMVAVKEIMSFESNGEVVKLKELYPGIDKYYCCFYIDGYHLKLMSLESKTIEEIRATGYDYYRNSRVPFIVTITTLADGNKQVVPVNLEPFMVKPYVSQTKPKEVEDGTEDEWSEDQHME